MTKLEIDYEELDYHGNEAYKSLRTNLQFCGADKKVIVITSCTPNEGKSSVALNLSKSLAEAGKRVLLVDADLRMSSLIGKVSVNEQMKGLSHYLSHQNTLKDVVNATMQDNLHIILSGPFPPNPTELLSGAAFKEMIAVVKKIYDYIMIDTPPLGSVIDSAIAAEEADGALLVIESGVISQRFAQNVKAQLEASNCPILGAILNKVENNKHGKYGRYGKYQRRYYKKKYETKS